MKQFKKTNRQTVGRTLLKTDRRTDISKIRHTDGLSQLNSKLFCFCAKYGTEGGVVEQLAKKNLKLNDLNSTNQVNRFNVFKLKKKTTETTL